MMFLYSVIISCISVACVSVPKETPLLSEERGIQLHGLEQAYLNLTCIFFDKERGQVRRFVDKEWVPLYGENIFK